MVELDNEIIDILKRVSKALEGSSFVTNRFSLFETGAEGTGIEIDIRRHKKG